MRLRLINEKPPLFNLYSCAPPAGLRAGMAGRSEISSDSVRQESRREINRRQEK